MPLLRLGEQRLDPDLALPDRFLVRLGGVVAAHLLQVVDVERALHLAAVVAGRALRLERANIADSRFARYATTPSVRLVEYRRRGCPCGQRYSSRSGSKTKS